MTGLMLAKPLLEFILFNLYFYLHFLFKKLIRADNKPQMAFGYRKTEIWAWELIVSHEFCLKYLIKMNLFLNLIRCICTIVYRFHQITYWWTNIVGVRTKEVLAGMTWHGFTSSQQSETALVLVSTLSVNLIHLGDRRASVFHLLINCWKQNGFYIRWIFPYRHMYTYTSRNLTSF